MSASHRPPSPLDFLRRVVERRAGRGESLARIEAEVLASAPLDEERRAALWLYAWHHVDAEPRACTRVAPTAPLLAG